jgi:hypothetical protein
MCWKLCSFAYKFQLFIAKLGELNVALICCSPVCHFAALFTLLLCVGFGANMHKREPCCIVCPATQMRMNDVGTRWCHISTLCSQLGCLHKCLQQPTNQSPINVFSCKPTSEHCIAMWGDSQAKSITGCARRVRLSTGVVDASRLSGSHPTFRG